MAEPGDKRRDGLYGRRQGRPLSARRAGLMAQAYPALALDVAVAPPRSAAALFAHAPSFVQLEIGFGGGEHLVAEAAKAPASGFIGVEPFINGMANAVASVVDGGLKNVRLFQGEASKLLDWLPEGSLDAVDLLYPDPWPKKRHWKRRFVSEENLARLARVLKGGGAFRFASDIPGYVEWTLARLAVRSDFVWTAERADDWQVPFSGWSRTRYEAKAVAAGRVPTYLTFRRV